MNSQPEILRAPRWGAVAGWSIIAAALAACIAAALGEPPPVWLPILLAVAGLSTIAAGVAWQGSGVFARPMLSVRTSRPELALTFDDGPNPAITRPVLDLLESRGHRGTFFVIGRRAEEHVDFLREIVQRGHGLANHSYAHSYATPFAPPGALAKDLRRTNDVIASVTGSAPRWFRPPIGLLSPRVAEAAGSAGLDLVAWTASARDGNPATRLPDAVERLTPGIAAGAILVIHDAVPRRAEEAIAVPLLKEMLDRIEAKGLKSVTLDQLVAGAPA